MQFYNVFKRRGSYENRNILISTFNQLFRRRLQASTILGPNSFTLERLNMTFTANSKNETFVVSLQLCFPASRGSFPGETSAMGRKWLSDRAITQCLKCVTKTSLNFSRLLLSLASGDRRRLSPETEGSLRNHDGNGNDDAAKQKV